MKNSDNPWLGLLSYQDPYKTKGKEYVFCGRDSAVSSLFSMVDNSIIVTIYGKTGIGKTSVLNAGVCPILRSQGYLPILVRLGNDIYSKTIISRIENEVILEGGRIITQYPDLKEANPQSVDYLWKYLCTTSFISKDNTQLFPVVILDQFEEIFLSSTEKSTLLLKQLYALIDDNKEVPEDDGYSNITNYRFVISIREDDLFYLEDAIDANYLADLKQNRYRLAPLKDQEARDIIALGKEYIEESEFDEISNKIIKQAKDENGQISTNILSLICSQIFLQADGKITVDTLNKIAQNPLESFYNDCVKHISPNTKAFIEENLVDNDRRKFVKKKVFYDENIVPLNDRLTLTQGQYRIIQDVTAGNIKCIELIHDSIARTIFLHKLSEQEKEKMIARKKRSRSILILGIVLALASVIGITYSIIKTNKYKNEKGLGVQQRFSINFSEEIGDIPSNDFWRATVLVTGICEYSIDTLLYIKINDEYKDSTLYFVSDSAKTIKLSLKYDKEGIFSNTDTSFTIGQLTERPNIILPIKKIIPEYIEYKGKVVSDISGIEIGLSNAIIVIRNIVQRTKYNGEFTLSLPDSLTNTDIIYIIKDGFALLEQTNFIIDGFMPDKFVLKINDDFFLSSSYSSFDSICSDIDNLLTDKANWKYGYGKYRQGGYKIKYSDGSTDNLVVLAQRKGTVLKGVFWFANELKKFLAVGKPHYAYYVFEGTMDKEDGLRKDGDVSEYEISGYNMFNNKKTIRGTLMWPGVFSGEIRSNDNKESIGIF